LLEAIRLIVDKEKEVGRILEEAKQQADRIRREAQEKREEIFEETYNQIIAETKRKSIELNEKATEARRRACDVETILRRAEKQIREIQARTRERFERAVNFVISEMIS